MANRPKLLIFASLILLRFEPRDAFGACAHVEFQFFAPNFDETSFLLQRFNARLGRRQLRFKISTF